MREEELRRYFAGRTTVEELDADLRGSVIELGDRVSAVQIADMTDTFELTRQHLIMLCEAMIRNILEAEALSTIAFALLASDTFHWEDEVVSEVLSDWSAPEINFALSLQTINMHREWLVSSIMPVQYRSAMTNIEGTSHLLSIRSKVSARANQ